MNEREFRIKAFKKASLCRNFEESVYHHVENKDIKFPTYISAGQEYIPASLAVLLQEQQPYIYAQHRAHSWYLAFGGNMERLIDELLGRPTGCAYGMGGSASIHCPDINMVGHDGLMGSQVPIAVGACYSNKKPTVAVMGDASAEEDYVLGAMGWASTKQLPILFIVEDNNLSILTEKKVRRNWEMNDVANAFRMEGYDLSDDPLEIFHYRYGMFEMPRLLNIRTNRLYWHAGAGIDDPDTFDRYKAEMSSLGSEAEEIHELTQAKVKEAWLRQLEIQ